MLVQGPKNYYSYSNWPDWKPSLGVKVYTEGAEKKDGQNLNPTIVSIAVSVVAFAFSVIFLVMNSMFLIILRMTYSELGAWNGYPLLYTFLVIETIVALVLAIASGYFLKKALSNVRYIRAAGANQSMCEAGSGSASTGTSSDTDAEYRNITDFLDANERDVYEMILSAGGSILQRNIVNQDRYSRSKVTRILDRLQRMGLVDRVRHGSTNLIVVRKQSK